MHWRWNDTGSALVNHLKGDHNKAKQKCVDAGVDVVSMAVPGLAAPMAKGLFKGGSKVDNIINSIPSTTKKIEPNNGIAKPHGKSDHNEYIDKMIYELKEGKGNENVRKNQKQVDVNGNTVGNNRPDIQWDNNGVHHNFEIDRTSKSNLKHEEIIRKNDPNSVFHKKLL